MFRCFSNFVVFCYVIPVSDFLIFFFFNDTATTEIYTLSLHDALPIFVALAHVVQLELGCLRESRWPLAIDRKSTRLNSSHLVISYAVFCLKKKKKYIDLHQLPNLHI